MTIKVLGAVKVDEELRLAVQHLHDQKHPRWDVVVKQGWKGVEVSLVRSPASRSRRRSQAG